MRIFHKKLYLNTWPPDQAANASLKTRIYYLLPKTIKDIIHFLSVYISLFGSAAFAHPLKNV
jgi:hypothetical protein